MDERRRIHVTVLRDPTSTVGLAATNGQPAGGPGGGGGQSLLIGRLIEETWGQWLPHSLLAPKAVIDDIWALWRRLLPLNGQSTPGKTTGSARTKVD